MKHNCIKKCLCIILSILFTAGTFCSCSKEEYIVSEPASSSEISVVSFNCAAPWGNLLNGTASSKRVKLFAKYMYELTPDIIGTQEMNSKWLDKLSTLMASYSSYGVMRGGDENDNKSEMNAVFWLTDKYDCLEKNTFWLSETPDEESRYEGAGCNRICSYVVLQDKTTENQIIFMNTHLDNASEQAREYGINVILEKLPAIQESYPQAAVVLTGDFNDVEGSLPYNAAASVLTDCGSVASEKVATYHDWGEITGSTPIDFIFTSATPVNYETLIYDGDYISDHYGIMATVSLQ